MVLNVQLERALSVLAIACCMMVVQLALCTAAIYRLQREVSELRKRERQQPGDGCWRCVTSR